MFVLGDVVVLLPVELLVVVGSDEESSLLPCIWRKTNTPTAMRITIKEMIMKVFFDFFLGDICMFFVFIYNY